mmetsp:Transcript_11033/g.23457  ORF Transcript_11033/g.23457 Transcript_11033/m.23457 type:complete len:247 (-) Transcript_11033:27-767(-)
MHLPRSLQHHHARPTPRHSLRRLQSSRGRERCHFHRSFRCQRHQQSRHRHLPRDGHHRPRKERPRRQYHQRHHRQPHVLRANRPPPPPLPLLLPPPLRPRQEIQRHRHLPLRLPRLLLRRPPPNRGIPPPRLRSLRAAHRPPPRLSMQRRGRSRGVRRGRGTDSPLVRREFRCLRRRHRRVRSRRHREREGGRPSRESGVFGIRGGNGDGGGTGEGGSGGFYYRVRLRGGRGDEVSCQDVDGAGFV